MSADIISFPNDGVIGDGLTVPVSEVLECANVCTDVVVAGRTSDGELYLATTGSSREALWLLAQSQAFLLNQT